MSDTISSLLVVLDTTATEVPSLDRYVVAELCRRSALTIRTQVELNQRAMAIISDAIMHGMPVTEEVADVRNRIVGACTPQQEDRHE